MYTLLLTKIFLPPLTPKGVYQNIDDNNKIENINFIIKANKIENKINKKKTFLIMDNGTQTLSKLISVTVPFLEKFVVKSKYHVVVGDHEDIEKDLKSHHHKD